MGRLAQTLGVMTTVRAFSGKEEAEQAAFRAFAERMREGESWLTVESKIPPAPDLLCVHEARGPIAFELVAITDPEIAKISAGHGTTAVSGIWTADPTERIIRKKLGRHYETPYPIHLLIYNDLLTITPDESIIEIARNWLGSKDHPFDQAWYMGEFECILLWRK